jgi:2,3-bisphosphoglycerate-dependent phosphoglycerate mutase
MTEFYFVRHAETELNILPHIIGGRSNHAKLTSRGERQAAQFGTWLSKESFSPDAIYISPAHRTRETVRLIIDQAGYHAVPLYIDDRLQELSQGIKEGVDRRITYTDEVQRRIHQDPFGFKFEKGESIQDVMDRMHEALLDLHMQHTGQKIMIVTHGFAIRSLVGHIEQHDHDDIVFGMRIPNVSLTHLSINKPTDIIVHTLGRDVAKVEFIS